jgi:hypothetical protein
LWRWNAKEVLRTAQEVCVDASLGAVHEELPRARTDPGIVLEDMTQIGLVLKGVEQLLASKAMHGWGKCMSPEKLEVAQFRERADLGLADISCNNHGQIQS